MKHVIVINNLHRQLEHLAIEQLIVFFLLLVIEHVQYLGIEKLNELSLSKALAGLANCWSRLQLQIAFLGIGLTAASMQSVLESPDCFILLV